MNKIDGLIKLLSVGSIHDDGTVKISLIPEDRDIVVEALQAMKDKECITEQPDTIHNDDCVKQTIQEFRCDALAALREEAKNELSDLAVIAGKNPAPNLTQDEPCVRDALEDLDMIKYHHNQLQEVTFNSLIKKIRTALLAKQPDIERLKRVEEVLNAAIDDNETSTGRLQNIHIARNLLRAEMRSMMEGK